MGFLGVRFTGGPGEWADDKQRFANGRYTLHKQVIKNFAKPIQRFRRRSILAVGLTTLAVFGAGVGAVMASSTTADTRTAKKLSTGTTHGRAKLDPEAIKHRLAVLVESGEITQEQANARLARLRQRLDAGKAKKSSALTDEEIEAKLNAAVTAGKITEDQARNKRLEYRRWLHAGKPKKPSTLTDEEIEAKLRTAITAGEITEEQARKKRFEYRWWLHAGKTKKFSPLTAEKIEAKLRIAVENGELTHEQASAKLRALQTRKHLKDGAKK